VKSLHAITLLESTCDITAICHNQQRTSVISLGFSNGYCKDYDLNKRRVIRNANIHDGQTVQAITSRGKYLVSVGVDGRTVVYDYAK